MTQPTYKYRMFCTALASTFDFKQRGNEVTILFQGTGTRWIGELTKEDHLFNELFCAVEDKVAGVSSGCANAFGGAAEADQAPPRLRLLLLGYQW